MIINIKFCPILTLNFATLFSKKYEGLFAKYYYYSSQRKLLYLLLLQLLVQLEESYPLCTLIYWSLEVLQATNAVREMPARHCVAQRQKFDNMIIGSPTRKMSRRNQVDLKKVEKRRGLVPYKNKENNLTTSIWLILISALLVHT